MRKVRSSRHNRRHQPSTAVRLKQTVANGIRAVTDSPLIKFTTGMVLLTSGLDEAIETIFADLSALELGAHHGVMVLGFVNVLSSLPDMLDGLSSTFLVDEKGEEPADADIASAGGAASPSPAGLNDQRERQRRGA
jgi:hypothetical protein